jgi:cysteine-rich repeat protein/predicted outer membrane repeat protein
MISAIVYNTAEKGGGIAQNDHYPVTLGAVTISNNQSYYDGGGIYIFSINEAFVLNGVTVAENTCCSSVGSNGGGGIYTEVDIVSFENTIIANNSDSGLNAGPNCYGTIISNDYNIVTDDTGCTIEGTVDHFYTTETLGSLDDNGGDTLTHAILADGNAIDGGNDITCLYMDQRGFNRRGVCDIGAYEYQYVCGDALVEVSEECDDGNSANTDACLNTCVEASCGDGYLQTGVEECDDSNTDDGDGCSSACEIEEEVANVCGDGVAMEDEECDDGNTANTDACLNTCQSAACGDGYLQSGVEECDDNNTDDGDNCSGTCTLEEGYENTCGDDIVAGDEECDDGNTDAGDGCDATCMNEGTVAEQACGNGVVNEGEECDDGNSTDGDGCSASCTDEESATHQSSGGGCSLIIPN